MRQRLIVLYGEVEEDFLVNTAVLCMCYIRSAPCALRNKFVVSVHCLPSGEANWWWLNRRNRLVYVHMVYLRDTDKSVT